MKKEVWKYKQRITIRENTTQLNYHTIRYVTIGQDLLPTINDENLRDLTGEHGIPGCLASDEDLLVFPREDIAADLSGHPDLSRHLGGLDSRCGVTKTVLFTTTEVSELGENTVVGDARVVGFMSTPWWCPLSGYQRVTSGDRLDSEQWLTSSVSWSDCLRVTAGSWVVDARNA